MEKDLHDLLLIFALQNAVQHSGLPKSGTVVARLLGKYPEYRPRAKELIVHMEEIVAEIDLLSPQERKSRLEILAPDLAASLQKPHEQKKQLPPLEGAESGVVMRFAPNPSGPLHLGHARAAVLNDAYVTRYGGKYILRIEDTDPKRVDSEAYRMVPEDIAWLGIHVDEVVFQSDRLDIYYEYCRKLIRLAGAYVCTCENEQWKELKAAKVPCRCRGRTVDENLELFEEMLAGGFHEGEASVRVITDLDHPDPAMRDFPAFRILEGPIHPRIEDARVYPLMNFSVAIDDHLLGVTHVIRGKDHIANTGRQRYLFDYFGWDVPVYKHYGRMGIEGVVLSTSQMRRGIAEGIYTGWDDIRLGTLRALARRGISPVAVREAVLDIGTGETDIQFSWDNLYAKNRAIADPDACRWFFVPDPLKVRVEGAAPRKAKAMLHPADEARGFRVLPFSRDIYLPRQELLHRHPVVRCKDLFNIDPSGWEEGVVQFAGDALADARTKRAPIIQWLPVERAMPCVLKTLEGDVQGLCEPGIRVEVGNVIQFERVCFARIDSVTEQGAVAYFTHR